MSQLLTCRLCQGNHLTLKCPTRISDKSNKVQEDKPNKVYEERERERKSVYVSFSNLPMDLDEDELREMLSSWAPIGRIFFNYYEKNMNAKVEFKDEIMAKRAIYQLDKTSLESSILAVQLYKHKPRV